MMKLNEREKVIMQEAFMTGRVYASFGEIETPSEIQEELEINCKKAVVRFENKRIK